MAELPLLDANLKTASQGMAVSVNKPLGQAYYARYYRAAAAEDYVRLAIAGAEANPYVDVANAATAALNKVQADYEARRDLVQGLAQKQKAAQAKLNAARIKAASKTGVRGASFKEIVDAVKGYGDLVNDAASMYDERVDVSDVASTLDRAKSYGNIDSLKPAAIGAMQQLSQTIGRDGFDPRQLLVIAKSDAEGANAIQQIQGSADELKRGSAAAAMTELLTDKTRMGQKVMSESAAAQVAADMFKVPAHAATAKGKQLIQQQLFGEMKNIVAESEAEKKSYKVVQPLMNELIRMAINGDGGKALAAERKRQAAKKLTPDERGALDLFIAALRNDGMVDFTGETVTIDGVERPLSPEELKAGKAAFDKAKKFGAYRVDEAQWFDEEAMDQFRSSLKYGADADKARAEALARGSRTPDEVQREMAERFLRTATAAEDLEVYIPAERVSNRFEAQALGGAMHIANREGNLVFEQTREAPDRKRRLGGLGPVATGPLRAAQDVYRQLAPGDQPVLPADLKDGVEQLRRKYANNPKKAMLAVQYLLAQNMVRERAQQNPASAEPGANESNSPLNRDANRPPTPDVSGAQAAVDSAKAYVAAGGGRATPLNVSRALQDELFGSEAPPPAPAGVSAPAPAAPATDAVSNEAALQQLLGDAAVRAVGGGGPVVESTPVRIFSDTNTHLGGNTAVFGHVAPRATTSDRTMSDNEVDFAHLRNSARAAATQAGLGTKPISTAGDTGKSMNPITLNNGSRQPGTVRTQEEINRATALHNLTGGGGIPVAAAAYRTPVPSAAFAAPRRTIFTEAGEELQVTEETYNALLQGGLLGAP